MRAASRTRRRPAGTDFLSVMLFLCASGQLTWAVADDVQQRICGAKALVAALAESGVPCDLEDVLGHLPNHGENSSLQELSEVARLTTTVAVLGVRWRDRPPVDAPPAIVPVVGRNQRRHFVTVLKWGAERILVQDDTEQIWVPIEALRQIGWNGTALHVSSDIEAIAAIKPRWWEAGTLRWAIAAACFGLAAVLHFIPVGYWKHWGSTSAKSSASLESM